MIDVIAELGRFGLLPVVELPDVRQAEPMFDALCAGGLPVAEITLRTPAGLGALSALARAYPDALVGAGTVRTYEDAARAIGSGAHFVVSPGLDLRVVSYCLAQGVLPLPGVCTPTEIQSSVNAGVNVVKLFPAEPIGGAAFLKALSGPFGDVRFVPTGGVNPANLATYLKLPQVVACGGSWMVRSDLLVEGNYAGIQELTEQAVRAAAEIRAT